MLGTALWVFAFSIVGLLISIQRPGNPIAWTCLWFGTVWTSWVFTGGLLTYQEAHPGTVPHPDLIAALAYPLWVPGVGLIAVLLLIFPSGRLLSPRWRPVAWVLGITMGALVLIGWFGPGPIQDHEELLNPLGISWVQPFADEAPGFVIVLSLMGCLLAAAVSVVMRFRRSEGTERLQMKWLVAAGVVSAIGYPLLFIREFPVQILWASIPIAIGFSMHRHRLYDIDRLVSRTVVYAIVVGVLALVYAGAATLLGAVLPLKGEVPVAAATLASVALFTPLRRRVQERVDRRFNRSRYDAVRVTARLLEALRSQTDARVVLGHAVSAVAETMQPTAIGAWLNE